MKEFISIVPPNTGNKIQLNLNPLHFKPISISTSAAKLEKMIYIVTDAIVQVIPHSATLVWEKVLVKTKCLSLVLSEG